MRNVLGHPRGDNVGVACEFRIHRTGRIAHQAREMNDRRRAIHGAGEFGDIGRITVDQFEMRVAEEWFEGLTAVHQLVENANLVAGGQQKLYRV